MNKRAYLVKQQCAPFFGGVKVTLFSMDRPKTTKTLSENVRALMKEFGYSKQNLAQKSGVSDRTIGYILAADRGTSVEIVNDIAKAFGLVGWQLLIPQLPVELAKTGKLDKLVKNYSDSTNQGREYIDLVAEREADYKKRAK